MLCAVCEKGWYPSSSSCLQCSEDMSDSIWFTAGLSVGIIVAVIVIVLLDLRFGWSRAKAGSQRLKLMVNCVQQMTVMVMFPVKWPDAVKDMGKLFSSFSIDVSIVSPTCLGVPMDFFSRFAISVTLVFFGIFLPWVVAALVAVSTAACRGRTRGEQREQGQGDGGEGGDAPTFRQIFRATWRRVQPTAARYSLLIMLFAHPAVSGQTFFFFSCQEIDGDMYLIADYSLRCNDAAWRRMLPLALFMVIFFVIGVPLLLLVLLVNNRTAIKKIGRAVNEALEETAVLEEMGETIDIDKARALYRNIDVDSSGSIDFAEFTKFWLNHNDREAGTSGEVADIVKKMTQRTDSPEVKSLGRTALGLMNSRVGRRRSIRRKRTGTAIGNALATSHAAEQDEEDARTVHEGAVEGRVRGMVVGEREREGTAPRTQSRSSLEMVTVVGAVGRRGGEGKGNSNNRETDASTEAKGAAGGMLENRPKASMRKRGSLVAAHISHQQVTRNLAGDVQGATLARERMAAEGDGVEMMLGVLWLNYKPEYFFFDM